MRITIDISAEELAEIQGICSDERKDLSKDESAVLAAIDYLAHKLGEVIPLEEIYAEAKILGLNKRETERSIDLIMKQGIIYEVREGFIERI